MEVDDKIQTHPLYKEIIAKGVAYGAERWIMELQRMCERFAAFFVEKIPDHDAAGGYTLSYSTQNPYAHIYIYIYIYMLYDRWLCGYS